MKQAGMLTRQQILDLMAVTARSKPGQDSDRPYRPHDWRQCRYFNDQQITMIRTYLDKGCLSANKALESLCRLDLQTNILSIAQEYAVTLMKSLSIGTQDYCMPFEISQAGAKGLLLIPEQTAILWVQWLLGGQGTEGHEGLSTLEEFLLVDCAKAVVQTLGHADFDISIVLASSLQKGTMGFMWDQMEAILSIELGIQQSGKTSCQAKILLPCVALSKVVGNQACPSQMGPEVDNSSIVMQCIEDLPVEVSVQICTVVLRVADLVGLDAGDVAVLDRRLDEPVDVIIEGKKAFLGMPVQYKGQLAVQIIK